MKTEEWIEIGWRELKGVCDRPLFESQVLLSSVLNLSPAALYFKENSALALKSQREFIKRVRLRKKGCPVAYITGEKEFFNRRFFTGPGVFIPRPETEGLVELALSVIYPSGDQVSGSTERVGRTEGAGRRGRTGRQAGRIGETERAGMRRKGQTEGMERIEGIEESRQAERIGGTGRTGQTGQIGGTGRTGQTGQIGGTGGQDRQGGQGKQRNQDRQGGQEERGGQDRQDRQDRQGERDRQGGQSNNKRGEHSGPPLLFSLSAEINGRLKEKSFRGVDFGAGTGCVALTLALENPSARFVAVESAASARPYLEKNRAKWKMEQRVDILNKDVRRVQLNDIKAFLGGGPNIITANPPYIDRDDGFLEDSVRRFEPPSALFSGKKGLAHIYSWAEKAFDLVCSGGVYIFEIGCFQALPVKNFLDEKKELKSYKIHKDLQGRDRVAVCVKK